MDIVAEFTRLSRAAPKVLCPPALQPFACGAAAAFAESPAQCTAEMVTGSCKQRHDCWMALDFGTAHQVNVTAVWAQHSWRIPEHMLQVDSDAAFVVCVCCRNTETC